MRPYMLWLARKYSGIAGRGSDAPALARLALNDWVEWQQQQWWSCERYPRREPAPSSLAPTRVTRNDIPSGTQPLGAGTLARSRRALAAVQGGR